MEIERIYTVVSGLAALLAAALGGLPALVAALLLLQAIDILSGVIAAVVRKELNSTVGRAGIGAKAQMWLVVVMAEVLARVLSEATHTASLPFSGAALIAYCWVEGISIVENVGRSGAPVPRFMRDTLVKLREEFDRAPAVLTPAPGQPVIIKPPDKTESPGPPPTLEE